MTRTYNKAVGGVPIFIIFLKVNRFTVKWMFMKHIFSSPELKVQGELLLSEGDDPVSVVNICQLPWYYWSDLLQI